jgi:hypothetical protein
MYCEMEKAGSGCWGEEIYHIETLMCIYKSILLVERRREGKLKDERKKRRET